MDTLGVRSLIGVSIVCLAALMHRALIVEDRQPPIYLGMRPTPLHHPLLKGDPQATVGVRTGLPCVPLDAFAASRQP